MFSLLFTFFPTPRPCQMPAAIPGDQLIHQISDLTAREWTVPNDLHLTRAYRLLSFSSLASISEKVTLLPYKTTSSISKHSSQVFAKKSQWQCACSGWLATTVWCYPPWFVRRRGTQWLMGVWHRPWSPGSDPFLPLQSAYSFIHHLSHFPCISLRDYENLVLMDHLTTAFLPSGPSSNCCPMNLTQLFQSRNSSWSLLQTGRKSHSSWSW